MAKYHNYVELFFFLLITYHTAVDLLERVLWNFEFKEVEVKSDTDNRCKIINK